MAERLTDKDYFAWHYRCGYQNKKDSLERTQKEHKLGKLEDILEKYDKSVEELDDFFANYKVLDFLTEERIKEIAINEQRKVMQSMIKEITEKECNQLYTELNTWQKACELACETLKQVMGKPLWIGGNIPTPEVKDSDYFYQQAKTEVNDEND